MLSLEKLQDSDLPTLISWIDSERELRQWAAHSLSYPLNAGDLTKFLKAPDTIGFKALQNGEMVGYADFSRINKKNGTATICRVLVSKNSRGRGIASGMLRKMCSFAFTELSLRRIELIVFAFNEPAIRVYEKLGFKREGRLREWLSLEQNENWDAIQMGLLKREFPGPLEV